MTEETRKKLNAERLKLVDVSIRAKVKAVLATMEHYGHRPLIGGEVWRSPAEQLAMVRRGVSKLKWGFHCATTKDGKPASLAADIVDAEKAWGASDAFWLTLGYAARAQGLGWGGYWGLGAAAKKRLSQAIDWAKTQDDAVVPPMPKADRGWDVAHVEVTGITPAQARAGMRP
jgi:hypothetical protein